MEKPFFEFDLTKEYNLNSELDKLYEFCHNTNRYTKLILRGPDMEGFENGLKFFDSYSSLLVEYNKIQKWLEENNDIKYGQFSLFGESINWKDYPLIYNYILVKVLELYGDDIIVKKISDSHISIKKMAISEPLLTMYKKGGILTPHKDGKAIEVSNNLAFKPANILLYLNKNYDSNWGGNFVVDNQIISPQFGKLVFLNFRGDSDPEHEVSLLIEDTNRIALLFNIMYSTGNLKEICKIPNNFVYL